MPASAAGGLGTSGGGDVIAFVDDDTLVGYTNSLSSFDLTVMDVDVRGVHVVRSFGGSVGGNTGIVAGGGYVYSDGGSMIDVATLRAVGKLPVSGAILPDPAGGRVYVLHGSGPTTSPGSTPRHANAKAAWPFRGCRAK